MKLAIKSFNICAGEVDEVKRLNRMMQVSNSGAKIICNLFVFNNL